MDKPTVSIIMGSDSDLPVVKAAMEVLEEFGIPHEAQIISAHRTPDRATAFAASAEERGIEVIIAAAGGAAHLAGVIAAITPLPVIGIPIKSSTLSGVDSLYSIVQMPSGIPVATVAINGAKNAGILAAQILGAKDKNIREKVKQYKEKLVQEVERKSQRLLEVGYKNY